MGYNEIEQERLTKIKRMDRLIDKRIKQIFSAIIIFSFSVLIQIGLKLLGMDYDLVSIIGFVMGFIILYVVMEIEDNNLS